MNIADRFSKILLVALAASLAGACAEPAYGDTFDPERDATRDPHPARTPDPEPLPAPETGPVPGDDVPPLAPGLAKCPELGIPAWSCASFENDSWGPAWTANANSNAVVQVKQPSGGTNHVLQSLFHQIPTADRATLGVTVPPQSMSVALRFSFRAPTDGYPARVTLGGLVGAGGTGGLVLALRSDKKLSLDDETSTMKAPLGSVTYDRWTCVELELGQAGTVRAWIDGKLEATFNVQPTRVQQMTRAEIGLTHRGPANQGASVVVAFDDVVVGPAAVGCR